MIFVYYLLDNHLDVAVYSEEWIQTFAEEFPLNIYFFADLTTEAY